MRIDRPTRVVHAVSVGCLAMCASLGAGAAPRTGGSDYRWDPELDNVATLPIASLADDVRGDVAGGACESVGGWVVPFAFSNVVRGDKFEMDQPATLESIMMELDINEQLTNVSLFFSVFIQDADDASLYTAVYNQTDDGSGPPPTVTDGMGRAFYTSGPLDPPVELLAGRTYAISAAWGAPSIVFARDNPPPPYPRPFSRGVVLGRTGFAVVPPLDDTIVGSFGTNTNGAYSFELCFAPAAGACCSVDLPGGCDDTLTEVACTAFGGFFEGEFTTCQPGGSPVCAFGSCCTSCGGCLDDFTQAGCDTLDGVWQGAETTCAAVDCSPALVTGACCTGATCTPLCAEDCAAVGGVYGGDGTDCTPNMCAGACCTDATCAVLTAPDCASIGGAYRGDGTDCDPNVCVGACCTGIACDMLSPGACAAAGGTYRGDATPCEPNPCKGACCVPDGCLDLAQAVCEAAPDATYQGDGTTCATLPPELECGGACCWGFDPQDLTACLIVPNRATCTEAQGFPNAVYRGDSTQCPQPPDDCNDGVYGACCFADGLCLNTTSAFCNAPWVLADYQGDGTTCAGLDNACGFGACCLIDGTCAEVDAASACDALGGSFTAGATCAAAACPVAGACCENGACTEVIQDACSGGGQFFRGEGTACDDVDLPPCGPGACCIDATCTPVIDITICDVLGGSFFHDMTCADVDCQGPVIAIVSSDPPDGAIDARQPSEPDGSNPDGWSAITLTFDGDAGGVTAADFTITSDPPGAAPAIVDVVPVGNTATLTFDGSIPLVAWTVVTHDPSGTSVRIGYLPADVDNGGVSNANDVLTVIDNLNGVIEPLATYQCDVDRTDLCNASDVLREIDLLNGAATYDVWNGASLPN